MQKNTTGAVVSRAGVLTVLVNNQLTDNHLSAVERRRARKQLKDIFAGKAGVPADKVQARLAERCLLGGAVVGAETPFGVITWGMN